MVDIVPTPGRIVLYKLSADDVEGDENSLTVGQVFPAIVVKVDGDKPDSSVVLRVFLDRADDLRVTTAVGDQPGTYHWMEYQRGQAAKYDELEKRKPAVDPGLYPLPDDPKSTDTKAQTKKSY